ncbi:YkgJ family cysteine cluster protein [Desulfobacter latus]|uniref:YkgJ family cysteine cluster protein n=1 Tax=Desulfobacter latus TaxID=2292 RepID=A0A850T8Q0_9BACT|nr:YkgJ family cysteine cluster protein [Desulfobacter latus]NWH03736.1 YkgJ family cysteine cluster protein [Desulfobacter latus]
MNDEMLPVALDDLMQFNCSSDNPCFNQCCRDLNQVLTPYDILRMKNAVNLPSRQFLREYTSRHTGPGSGLPVLTFKTNPATGHACPFVTDSGCAVYNDRPASCRMYPLARAIVKDRATGKNVEYFALIEEAHCKGFGDQSNKTVAQWLNSQDVDEHNAQNDKILELISLKNQIRPGKLESAEEDIFYMALYDLDNFKIEIQEKGLLASMDLPGEYVEKIVADDLSLLDFGIAWIKYQLFGKDLEIQD